MAVRVPEHSNPEYTGKTEYQGNQEVYEMPEEHKPDKPPRSSLKSVGLALVIVTVAAFLIIAVYSMATQSGSFL